MKWHLPSIASRELVVVRPTVNMPDAPGLKSGEGIFKYCTFVFGTAQCGCGFQNSFHILTFRDKDSLISGKIQ